MADLATTIEAEDVFDLARCATSIRASTLIVYAGGAGRAAIASPARVASSTATAFASQLQPCSQPPRLDLSATASPHPLSEHRAGEANAGGEAWPAALSASTEKASPPAAPPTV
jgi:hypothetical protein